MPQPSDPRPNRQRFPKDRRITRSADISQVIRRGTVAADGVLVVFVLRRTANPSAEPTAAPLDSRLGVTIPKKTGSAVVRNRWKRWIREAFRTQQHDLPMGMDIVVRPKKDAQGAWHPIQRSLRRLIPKAVSRLGKDAK